MADGALTYREAAASLFSLQRFPWRDLAVAGALGASWNREAAEEVRESTGGWSYRGSSLVVSPCRNRFVLWRCDGRTLSLLEVSLDADLTHSALRLVLRDPAPLLPDVCVQESGGARVVVLFATASSVYRLVLPHPEAIAKDAHLSSVGEGLPPSIFAFANETSFSGNLNSAAIFEPLSSRSLHLTSCAARFSASAHTTFALSSPSGAIAVVQLPVTTAQGPVLRCELKETSMINRLWSSFMPASLRGGSESEEAPESVAVHTFGGEVIVLALCKDTNLRLWSCKQQQCVMTHNLAAYLSVEDYSSIDKLVLRAAPGGTPSSLHFAVFFGVDGFPQLSLFKLLLQDSQLSLSHLTDLLCPPNYTLVDFYPSNEAVWGVWLREGEGEEGSTLVQSARYNGERPSSWKKSSLVSHPPQEIAIPPFKDPREAYLDELLYPGRFSSMAICKALELYGASPVLAVLPDSDQLRLDAMARVEEELHTSAGSSELTQDDFRDLQVKCWSKFYGCSLQYHQILSRPVGIFLDPLTGLVVLLKRGGFSLLHPADSAHLLGCHADASMVCKDAAVSKDTATFMECVALVRNQLSRDLLDSFVVDLTCQNDRLTELIGELLLALTTSESAESQDAIATIKRRFRSVSNLSAVLQVVMKALDPSGGVASSEGRMDSSDETDLQLAASDIFTGSIALETLSSSLQELCLNRMHLCRDVLLTLCLVEGEGGGLPPSVHSSLLPSLRSCLLGYHSLHWLSSQHLVHTPTSAVEANLRQLAALEISSQGSSRFSAVTSSSTFVQLYLSGVGGRELRTALAASHPLPRSSPLHPHWAALTPIVMTMLLQQLWPRSASVAVCEFLLAHCQHTLLQDFVSLVTTFVPSGCASRQFLLGQSYLCTGELYKAFDCFLQAAALIGDVDEPLLRRVVEVNNSEGDIGEEEEEKEEEAEEEEEEARLVRYWVKVMRLFEQVPAPTLVIAVAKVATDVADPRNPENAILWSTLFKYHLELGHCSEAYGAMMGNPDTTRKKECLRHFVVVLSERQKLKQLCGFPYTGLEKEIEDVIEMRAQSVSVVNHNYYDLLYCFHMSRGNFKKAASVMHEHGTRLGRESPSPSSLEKQANCYSMALTLLNLVEPRYAWVTVPAEQALSQNQKSSWRKRTHPSHASSKVEVEVLTVTDIEREYSIVRAKLKLLSKEPAMKAQLCSPFVSVEEILSLLTQVGLFDTAFDLALRCGGPPSQSLEPIFTALAAKCVHLSLAYRHAVSDSSSVLWLGMNQEADVTNVREKSLADKAWSLLQHHLERHDLPSHGHLLQKCVARKLISMGVQLPQWLQDRYKRSNPAELIRLYLTFDLLTPAIKLAIEYIAGVLGHGKEFFGLETALHASSPSVWLPHSVFDHLKRALEEAPPDSSLDKLSKSFNERLASYFRHVENVSEMKRSSYRPSHQPPPDPPHHHHSHVQVPSHY